MRFLFVIGIVVSSFFAYGQLRLPDNLKNAKYEEVLTYLNNAISKENNWTKQKVELFCYKAYWLNRNWEYQDAKKILDQIPVSSVKSEDCEGIYALSKAINAKYTNEPKLAEENFLLSEQFFQDEKDTILLIYTKIEEIEFFRKNAEFTLSEQRINEVYELLKNKRQQSYLYLKTRLLNREAAVLNETNKLNESIDKSKKSIQLANELNEKYFLAISYNELGFSFKNKGFDHKFYLDSSLFYYKKSEAIFHELGLWKEKLQVKENWVTTCSHNELYSREKIVDWYLEIEKEVNEKKINYDLTKVYQNLATQYDKNNLPLYIKYKELFYNARIQKIEKSKNDELALIKDNFKSLQLEVENNKVRNQVKQKDEELKRQSARLTIILVTLFIFLLFVIGLAYLFRQKRKLSNDLLKQNKEKDVLIQEIHHRVKNNLSFISSLLQMQQNSRKDVKESIVLQEANLRISSMSLVYEKLYVDHGDKVDLQVYCHDLVSLLKDSFNFKSDELIVDIDVEHILFDSREATSLGLIINEFFNNSVKYAFFETKNPTFSLLIKKDKEMNKLVIDIKDNGPGIKDTDKTTSALSADRHGDRHGNNFGLRLIDLLTRQLKGEGTWSVKNEMRYKITRPL